MTCPRPRRRGAWWNLYISIPACGGTLIRSMCSTRSALSASAATRVASKISARNVRQVAQGGAQPLYLAAPQEIVQRASLLLQDVHYVIEAHFTMTDRAAPSDNPGKFQDIVTRRMERGPVFPHPLLRVPGISCRVPTLAGRPDPRH